MDNSFINFLITIAFIGIILAYYFYNIMLILKK